MAFGVGLAFKYGRAIAYNDVCYQYSLQGMFQSAIFGLLAMTDFVAKRVVSSKICVHCVRERDTYDILCCKIEGIPTVLRKNDHYEDFILHVG